MDKILIRPEQPADQKDIYEVNKLAFGKENEPKLVDLLRCGQSFIPELSLVALLDNKIIGHILFTKIAIVSDDGKRHESLALAPLAVLPTYQKQGVGGKMVRYGLDKAKELGFGSVIVLGHEEYYPKFGFVPTDKWGIKCPFDVPKNAFMGIELKEGDLENKNGTVEYPKEFSDV